MSNEDKVIIAKWFILNKLIGVNTDIYNKVKNNEINDLIDLQEIIKTKGRGGIHLCLTCIHISNTICNRCMEKDEGFRFRYKYYKNYMIANGYWEKETTKNE